MAAAFPSAPLLSEPPEHAKHEPINPSTPLPPPAAAAAPPENPNPNPNMNPTPAVLPVPPPPQPAFAPSFRPLVPPSAPQYSAIPTYQPAMPPTPGVQPPGVAPPGSMVSAPQYYAAPPLPRPPYVPMPNGYMPFPLPGQPAAVAPPGIPRYPAPYPTMVRPGFPMRPPAAMMPPLSRPPIPGIRAPPVITPAIRPAVPIVAPTEKPQTTVYVGKIAPTVDNDFLLSLLRLCGPVKSWKRAQDPSDGTPKGFGFCEFEAAEGILRALRLLSKLNIDGQELVLNINQATREYLERYVEKKRERDIPKATEGENAEKENEVAADGTKPVEEKAKKDADDSRDNENQDNTKKFGIVTDEDREADRDALQKITAMIEERLKNKPLPPPPPVQTHADASVRSNSEAPSRSRDGESDVDIMKTDVAEDKNDDETTSEVKLATEPEKPGTSSPDRGRRHDRRSRERDRERDREYELKREKERELERYERERERERVRRERDREQKMREAERMYKERVKEWEAREREKEYQRQKEKDREKDRERERWREILRQEEESDDDDTRKRRHRSNTYEDKRRKRQREKEEDLADRLKEEQDIAEAKKRATEEQPPIDCSKMFPREVTNGNDKAPTQDEGLIAEGMEIAVDRATENDSSNGYSAGDGDHRNENSDEQTLGSAAGLDMKQNGSAPTRKLGFGLIGSGKRTAVVSVFHEEDDENVEEKKMRPLVPLDYSTEELQAVQTTVPDGQPNLVAAAEFAKRILVGSSKEKPDMEKERSKQPSDRSRQRERERNYDGRDENKKTHDKGSDREREREDKPKAENKKLLDAKQLIDMIPKTKEELFGYEINWDVYDKHKLHERMRPWISKKINEFLGEEEETLVEYIVTSTKDHVEASQMLELLQSILDDEAEMFVLKMWRMLIFEIKKVETGLSVKPRP